MAKRSAKQSKSNGHTNGNGHTPKEHISSKPFFTTDKVILAFSMLLVALFRLRLLGIPLERDEGGFAYIAQRLGSAEHQ